MPNTLTERFNPSHRTEDNSFSKFTSTQSLKRRTARNNIFKNNNPNIPYSDMICIKKILPSYPYGSANTVVIQSPMI